MLYLLAASVRAEAFARVCKRDSRHLRAHTIRCRENTGRIGEGTNLVRPGGACSCPLSLCSHTLLSFLAAPGTTTGSCESCPESTRHDDWLSRTFSCATLLGGHAARRLATERIPAESESAIYFTAAHANSPFWLPMLARVVRRRADTVLCPSLSFSLSLLPSLAAAKAAHVSRMGGRSHETQCFSFSSPRCSCCTPPLQGHPGTRRWRDLWGRGVRGDAVLGGKVCACECMCVRVQGIAHLAVALRTRRTLT